MIVKSLGKIKIKEKLKIKFELEFLRFCQQFERSRLGWAEDTCR